MSSLALANPKARISLSIKALTLSTSRDGMHGLVHVSFGRHVYACATTSSSSSRWWVALTLANIEIPNRSELFFFC